MPRPVARDVSQVPPCCAAMVSTSSVLSGKVQELPMAEGVGRDGERGQFGTGPRDYRRCVGGLVGIDPHDAFNIIFL